MESLFHIFYSIVVTLQAISIQYSQYFKEGGGGGGGGLWGEKVVYTLVVPDTNLPISKAQTSNCSSTKKKKLSSFNFQLQNQLQHNS